MRFHELYEGIEVLDEQNNSIGVSKLAAKKVNRYSGFFLSKKSYRENII